MFHVLLGLRGMVLSTGFEGQMDPGSCMEACVGERREMADTERERQLPRQRDRLQPQGFSSPKSPHLSPFRHSIDAFVPVGNCVLKRHSADCFNV